MLRMFSERPKNEPNASLTGLKSIPEFIFFSLFPFTEVEHSAVQFYKKL